MMKSHTKIFFLIMPIPLLIRAAETWYPWYPDASQFWILTATLCWANGPVNFLTAILCWANGPAMSMGLKVVSVYFHSTVITLDNGPAKKLFTHPYLENNYTLFYVILQYKHFSTKK